MGNVFRVGLIVAACALLSSRATAQEWPKPLAFEGNWTGTWKNSDGETGTETLTLKEKPDGTITGEWWMGIPVKGERLGPDTIYFEAAASKRLYRCVGRIVEGKLLLSYSAKRLDEPGKYYGESIHTPHK